MWVSWVTVGNCTSAVEVAGAADAAASRVVGGAGKKYSTTHATYGFYESEFVHHVRLNGLQPASAYTYRAGGQLVAGASSGTLLAQEAYSAYKSFRTPLAPGSREPVRFAIVGDLGQTADSLSTVHEVRNTTRVDFSAVGKGVEPSLMMLVGDLSYADGYGPRWDSWGDLMSPVLSELPLVAFSGNHEVEEDSVTRETFVHFRKRFPMPEVAPEQTAPAGSMSWSNYDLDTTYDYGSSYFSFDVGMVHAVCLNAYTHSEVGSTQYAWLERDLAAVDRRATPWVLVFAHAPWYNSNQIHQADAELATTRMKAAMEPLLHQHQVAAVWAGHVHAYERTHPVYREARDDAAGTVYVTIGDGGNREGLYDHWDAAAPEWVAVQNGQHFGRGDLLVVNTTHARWQWWPNARGDAEDEAWVVNPHNAEGSSDAGLALELAALLAAAALVLCAGAVAAAGLRRRRARLAGAADKAELLGEQAPPLHELQLQHMQQQQQQWQQQQQLPSEADWGVTSGGRPYTGETFDDEDEETVWEQRRDLRVL
jgi:hypothetical protein